MTTPETPSAKKITDMTFDEYNAYLKTLPFFKRMATMKVYNEYFARKVFEESARKIFESLDRNKESLSTLYNER